MGSHALTVFFFLLYLYSAFSQLPPNQVSTMTSVYQIFQNNTSPNFVWNNVGMESNPCSWRGVTCTSDNSSISRFSFQSFQLSTSEFLPILCQIDTLQSLDVSNNYLTSIPDGFFVNCGEISGLRLLNFSRNRLNGALPTFNGFRQLEFLDFSGNSLSGEIVSQLEGLDSLRSLNLSRNRFNGRIPTNLGRIGVLEELQLSWNAFTNEIPQEIITRYRNLSLIDLSLNRLSGSIPEELGQLTRLQVLVLSVNNLNGGIPNSLSDVTTLFRFAANQNMLNGTLPNGITSFLSSLDLSYNHLIGPIPSNLLSRPNLQSLDLSYNELEGQIPENISPSLFRLRLGSNSLVGILPAGAFGNLVELTYLELDNNSLNGPIPSELGMCRNLTLLNLAQNRFTGPLPLTLFNLTNLQVLNLQSNNLVGEIPVMISQLNRLERLNLSRNSFNGSIPPSISRLTILRNLDFEGNSLSGVIPNSISRLNLLIELRLGNNQLGGIIPEMPPNLQIALNLSHNQFGGLIPLSLSRLTSLEVLDLSDNSFSGLIPNFLTGMSSLTHIDLSNNQLSGIRPGFGPHVVVNTNGNNLIITNSNPTPAQQRRRSLSTNIVISFATASLVVIVMILVAFFISRRYYNRINGENREENETSPQIVHGHLLTPNSIHRSNIDFAKAMESVSDPSNAVSKTRFSTYYKSVMPSGASYFVKKLNWTNEKIFQLGGNEKFGKEMEVLAKLGNSNVMVPLAYVLTVDNAYLFYEFTPKGTLSDVLHGVMGNSSLDWANRYSIAIGVAQGLSFLHGSNSGPILLLDLSSKSIMLKSMNEPQIGDIDLCKVIDPLKNTGSISTVAGSVGYIPPEYAYTMRVTAAGNVYSFGVILLELLTGKPAVSRGTELAKWVLSNSTHQNKWDQILDFSVSKTSLAVRNQMLTVLKVALACVSVSPDARPKMKSVLRMLLNAR